MRIADCLFRPFHTIPHQQLLSISSKKYVGRPAYVVSTSFVIGYLACIPYRIIAITICIYHLPIRFIFDVWGICECWLRVYSVRGSFFTVAPGLEARFL